MKKTAISLLVLFFVAFTALGQSVTITPTTDKQITLTAPETALPNITGQRSGGTSDAPTALPNGLWFMSIYGRGYNGSGYSNLFNSAITFGAAQNFTPTANGSNIQFYTTPLNSIAWQERVRIDHNGSVGIGTSTFATGEKFAVRNGTTQFGIFPGYFGNIPDANWTTFNSIALRISGDLSVNGQITTNNGSIVGGFSKLGNDAPAIKVKKLTGTTGAAQGDIIPISHGLTSTKILSITVLVQFETNGQYVPHSYTNTNGYQFDFYSDATNIQVRNHPTNSGQILSKPIKVMITYEQ